MNDLHKLVVLSIGATLACTGAALAQLPVHPFAGAVQMAPANVAKKNVAVTHGTWMQGPGAYVVTVCESGCTINGAPATTIMLTIETWGAGGGGGGGQPQFSGKYGTTGGGGGGGGGYLSRLWPVTVSASGATTTILVLVGAGGASGASGGATEVKFGTQLLVGIAGGASGFVGGAIFGHGGNGGSGGVPDTPIHAVSYPGSDGKYNSNCNGGAGGTGGTGSGPSAINPGGNGGHGGYYNNVFQFCTSKGSMFGLSAGTAGANGRVKIVW